MFKRAYNVLIFVCVVLWGAYTILSLFGSDTYWIVKFGALYGPLVDKGEWYRLITAMFLHYGILHISFNMLALYALGRMVEEFYGTWKFITFYFVSGLAGNIASYFFYYNSVAIGASGAIFGLAGVLFGAGFRKDVPWFLERYTGMYIFPMIAINVFLGFIPGSHINNAAHIGGLLVGMAFGYFTRMSSYSSSLRWLLFSLKSGMMNRRRFLTEISWVLAGMISIVLTLIAFLMLVIRG